MGTALITGGGRGIGHAAAKALTLAGFDVAVVSLEPQAEVEDALRDLRSSGRKVAYFARDIANLDEHAALVHAVIDQFGPIDCLVNNAGVTSLRRGDLLDLTPESFDRSVAVNLRGTFFLTQAVARAMLGTPNPDSNYRSIITVTSANADIVGMNRGDYCMTKAALSMASKLFAARLAPAGIHVFELRPGIIRTDMTAPARDKYDEFIAADGVPLQRWGEPDEVGRTIATIASGMLPFATGEILNVGGGLHLHRV
jgi:3-oxoacyl-[acyl-carrier protein] reductase